MSSDRERRLKATGRWFQKPKKIDYLWVNNIFPILLLASLFFLLYNY
tara:strand:- start:799 stop:939 length:141 start_codon:yes stop_codon:yes gene_type:complete